MILKRVGYEATIYDSARPLLEKSFVEPDLFLIDRQLSDTDGLDVCRFLKSRESADAATPVIIFSASDLSEEQTRQAGANGFLQKPFKTKTLIDMIELHTA